MEYELMLFYCINHWKQTAALLLWEKVIYFAYPRGNVNAGKNLNKNMVHF